MRGDQQRQGRIPARVDQLARDLIMDLANAEAEPGRLRPIQGDNEATTARPVHQRRANRADELPATQIARRIQLLGGVHPPDRTAEARLHCE